MSVTTGTFPGVRIVDMPDLGAVTDASSVVGEHAGSGRFLATALRGYTAMAQIPHLSGGHFFASDGAKVDRLNDRVMMGGAAVSDCNFPTLTPDWLTTALNGEGYLIYAQSAVLSDYGSIGFTSGSRTSDNDTGANQVTIPVCAIGLNDQVSPALDAWGIYAEGRRVVDTLGLTWALELQTSNQAAIERMSPYALTGGSTGALLLGSGCGGATASMSPLPTTASVGLLLWPNPTDFDRGIVFGAGAIAGTNGVTGAGTAISFANGHAITWAMSPGSQTTTINTNVTSVSNAMSLVFADSGVSLQRSGSSTQFLVAPSPGSVNGISVVASVAGQPAAIATIGDDTNISLTLSPKGTGVVAVANLIMPSVDNGLTCGHPSFRWQAVYATNGTIQTSDPALKQDIAPLPSMLGVLAEINPVTFKWKDGGRRQVTRRVEADVAAIEEYTEEVDDVEMRPDGSARSIRRTLNKFREVFDEVPVLDAAGQPIVDHIRAPGRKGNDDARFEDRPRMHAVRRMRKAMTEQVEYVSRPGARTHWGFDATNVKAAFDGLGMDFGGYVRTEDGVHNLRPDQLIPVLWRAVQELSEKVAALEARTP
jgi:endosialidase-like protein